MKIFTATILLLLVSSLVLVSCKSKQKTSDSNDDNSSHSSTCTAEAAVMDFTGLSSCSILLKLGDGSFLDPIQGVSREKFLGAEIVKIDYEPIPDAMSSCMKGLLVKITCFKVIQKGTPKKGEID